MGVLKNRNHERFAHKIVEMMAEGVAITGKEAEGAYLTLGLSSTHAYQSGLRLMRNKTIKARIAEIRRNIEHLIEEKVAVDQAWVREKLIENVKRAMVATPVLDRHGEPIGEYTYNGSVANKALEILGKEMGMFVDKSIIDVNQNFVISDEPLTETDWENKYKTPTQETPPATEKKH